MPSLLSILEFGLISTIFAACIYYLYRISYVNSLSELLGIKSIENNNSGGEKAQDDNSDDDIVTTTHLDDDTEGSTTATTPSAVGNTTNFVVYSDDDIASEEEKEETPTTLDLKPAPVPVTLSNRSDIINEQAQFLQKQTTSEPPRPRRARAMRDVDA